MADKYPVNFTTYRTINVKALRKMLKHYHDISDGKIDDIVDLRNEPGLGLLDVDADPCDPHYIERLLGVLSRIVEVLCDRIDRLETLSIKK